MSSLPFLLIPFFNQQPHMFLCLTVWEQVAYFPVSANQDSIFLTQTFQYGTFFSVGSRKKWLVLLFSLFFLHTFRIRE